MTESNKVLSVSYGTFSCRVEGFDDSLSTMKAVVEYFHDLVGHEHFMDTELPAADSDTLARIAKKHTTETVDAQNDDGEISLRVKKATASLTDAASAAAIAPTLEKTEKPTPKAVEDVAEDELPETSPDNDTIEPTPTENASDDSEDSIAAKLQRIRAVVGKTAPAAIADNFSEDLTDTANSNAGEMPFTDTAKEEIDVEAELSAEATSDDFEIDDEDELAEGIETEEDFAAEEMQDEDFDDGELEPDTDLAAEPEEDEDAIILHEEVADVEMRLKKRRLASNSRREILPNNDDDAMSRIMSKTDERLSEPEGNRRRDAIAQLKAAVAATEAARQLGDRRDPKKEAENAFREDLDDAVRETPEAAPEPETSAETETQPLKAERPPSAPLKLVASQRVDNDSDEPVEAKLESKPTDKTAMRLRQIAAVKESANKTDDFEDFAEKMGATDLMDLLEAAAAYTSFVEGAGDFSRPQIMKKAQLASPKSLSREDGLRAFGMLVRQGRINKLSNGRFQVSKSTRFRPDAQAAQG